MRMNIKVVALSVAHHRDSPGAGYRGLYEHELSFEWTDELSRNLRASNIKVLRVPNGLLRDKVRFINRNDADMCMEIHFNGAYDPDVSGVETLYCPGSERGKKLARIVHSKYAGVMKIKDRGVKEGWYRMDRPGFEDYPGDVDGDERKDYFLQYTHCPALILEPDFISQQENLRDKKEVACIAIANGIKDYLLNIDHI